MRWIVIAAVLCLASARAYAGMGCEPKEAVVALEKLAKAPTRTPAELVDTYTMLCTRAAFEPDAAKLLPRIEKACTTILARDGQAARLCVEVAVRLGKTELGGVVMFDALSAWGLDPWPWDGSPGALQLFGVLEDPRAAPLIVDAWKANLAPAARREKRGRSMTAWAGWRKDAAVTLGIIGTPAEAAFLEEQAAATKDRHVRKACRDAIAAITKRAAPP